MAKKFKTKITEMLGIDYPIISGGMQWLSRAELVAAVANAGAIGFMTAESFETPEDLRAEIKKIRTLTDKPFGVNLSMIPELGPPERTLQFCDIVCEEGVKVVETAGRSPEPLMPKLKDSGVKVIHKLPSVRHAVTAQRLGVDAVTLIGFGSGGHIGMDNVASFILLPKAVEALEGVDTEFISVYDHEVKPSRLTDFSVESLELNSKGVLLWKFEPLMCILTLQPKSI